MTDRPYLSPAERAHLKQMTQFLIARGIEPDPRTGAFARQTLSRELERRQWAISLNPHPSGYRVILERMTPRPDQQVEAFAVAPTVDFALIWALERAMREDAKLG